MAEDENNEESEVIEQVDEGTDNYKRKLVLFLVIIGVLLALIIGAIVYIYWGDADDEGASMLTKYEKEFNQSAQSEIIKLKNPIFLRTQQYTVNLREGKHFLTMSVVFMFQDSQLDLYLKTRIPLIDDIVVSIMKKENVANLRTRAGLELLKREIFKQVNHLILEEYIPTALNNDRSPLKDVLITDFALH
jgi:flagellar basal body-associated protein FliL